MFVGPQKLVGVTVALVAATESALMVIVAVVLKAAQPPLAAIEYVTVYVPGVLVFRLISPVEALITRPAVELYAPPEEPVLVTVANPLP
jgi:hypothetical protein